MCPGLILPHFDAEFVINMQSLMQRSASWDIYGRSGKPLLQCSVQQNQRLVDISLSGKKTFPLGSFGIVADAKGDQLVILLPDKKRYGVLKPAAGGSYALEVNGEPLLHVKADEASQMILCLPGESKAIANAGRHEDSPDKLMVRVDAGNDGVLFICCVLAILLFGESYHL